MDQQHRGAARRAPGSPPAQAAAASRRRSTASTTSSCRPGARSLHRQKTRWATVARTRSEDDAGHDGHCTARREPCGGPGRAASGPCGGPGRAAEAAASAAAVGGERCAIRWPAGCTAPGHVQGHVQSATSASAPAPCRAAGPSAGAARRAGGLSGFRAASCPVFEQVALTGRRSEA